MNSDEMKKVLLNEKKASVELPVEYWKIILRLLDQSCEESVEHVSFLTKEQIYMLQAQNPEEISRLSGPILARALIVEALVESGVMKEEASEITGLEWLSGAIEEKDRKDMN